MALIPKQNESSSSKPGKKLFDALQVDCPPTRNATTALYAFVGEAPAAYEMRKKEPFVGDAGQQLSRVCSAAHIPRYQIYMTNCCKTQLPENKTTTLWNHKGYRHPQWGELQRLLIDELAECSASIIMLLGNTAMKMLLAQAKFDSITKYRGSAYRAEDFPHLKKLKGKIIILSVHPASLLYSGNPTALYTMIFDMKKMLSLAEDPTLLNDQPELITNPTHNEILSFLLECKEQNLLALDIEATPKFITCLSFAFKADPIAKSMCIPLIDNKGNMWTIEQETEIWQNVAEILNDPDIQIIAQNGMFDTVFILRTMNMLTDNFSFDTMLAQHLCYTDLPKGLDYLTSVYTYFPYYKDEGKLAHLKVIKDWPAYWNYNAKDSAYLIPIREKLLVEIEAFDCEESMQYQMELHKPLIEMEWNGILTDQPGIEKYSKLLSRRIKALQHGIDKVAGQSLNTNSSKQLTAYFYGTLALPIRKNRKTGNASCDTVALHRIAKTGKKGSVVAKLIIKMRKYHKLLSTYFTVNVDEDNRLRCSHAIAGTVSGRIATRKTFFGTGTNLQNQPEVYKRYLMADPEHLICEVDLAKAEAHVVAYLCHDVNMIRGFESGIDSHSLNASIIFGVPIEEVIAEAHSGKEQKHTMRYMGKKVVHASNYNMGPMTFSDQLAVENVFMSMSECKKLLENYKRRFPGLANWHSQVNEEVSRTRILYNLFGRPKRFLGAMNPALFRNAYSYVPQSTVAELVNKGSINISNDPRLGRDGYDIDLLTTVHDSDVFQFHIDQTENLCQILNIIKDHMTYTFTYLGKSFTIGLDATIGKRWKGDYAEISTFDQESIDKALEKIGV